MSVRHFGIIQAKIYPRKKQVVLTIKRGPGKVTGATVERLADWALSGVQDLERQGYEIDSSRLDKIK